MSPDAVRCAPGPLVALAARLFPFNYSVTSSGNDASLAVLRAELPFTAHEYPSGATLNGWTIPSACEVERAQVKRDGHVVFDGLGRPLAVPALSDSFAGRISLEELKMHLFTEPGSRSSVPYHWTSLYRPGHPIWGFCLSTEEASRLTAGEYEVDLKTRKYPSTMKVFVHELPGDSRDTILLNAHNCHPFQANDDISGIVVGIEVLKRLALRASRKFTYALMVAPELFGPMFWLDQMPAEEVKRLKATIMLKSVGNNRALRFQQSYHGNMDIDLAAHDAFRTRYTKYEAGKYRSIHGNDETVFESPPYAIPSISVTRWPFPEYHTDQDVPERLHEDRLEDTVAVVLDICQAMEMNMRPVTLARGLVCLSRYQLYKPVPPVGPNGVDYTSVAGRWNRLMNSLPRLMDGRTSLLEIARQFQLPIEEIYNYVQGWIAHGLARG